MAVPPNGNGLDQFEEGNASGGHASEVEAISSAVLTNDEARLVAMKHGAAARAPRRMATEHSKMVLQWT